MRRKNGFTLIELLVVITIILILIALLLPALESVQGTMKKVQCISNLKQLSAAWILYAGDYGGRLPSGGTNGGADWVGAGNGVAAITSGCIWPYVRSLKIYQCPSAVPPGGQSTTWLRSYSVNCHLNADCTWGTRLAEVRSPSRTYLLIEERDTRGYNGGGFVATPGGCPDSWEDFVANFHNASDNLAFVDGHVENYRWSDSRTLIPTANGWTPSGGCIYNQPGNDDLHRIEAVDIP